MYVKQANKDKQKGKQKIFTKFEAREGRLIALAIKKIWLKKPAKK